MASSGLNRGRQVGPADVSMMSPTDKWVQRLCVTNMWARSTVNGQYGPGPNWAGWAWIRAGLSPDMCCVGRPSTWLVGPPAGFGARSWLTVHRQAGSSGPLTQSIVDQAHFLLLSLRFIVERVHQAGASPGFDLWDRFMVDVCVRVHGPHTGSMVDCVHPPFSPPGSWWTGSGRGRHSFCSLVSARGGAIVIDELALPRVAVSPRES